MYVKVRHSSLVHLSKQFITLRWTDGGCTSAWSLSAKAVASCAKLAVDPDQLLDVLSLSISIKFGVSEAGSGSPRWDFDLRFGV